jgi:RHH-type proline utilization regulon transcriptional repressor/proline dehydrogenase/delta 1-pyrroline-5-carboxylate dehydrogenase
MIYNKPPSPLSPARAAINEAWLIDEDAQLDSLLKSLHLGNDQLLRIETLARDLVAEVRRQRSKKGGINALLQEYDLSSQEGVMLMCLAEALLRIPDSETADRLIRDKLSQAEWDTHLGKSHSFFVNASTWGLLLTGHIVQLSPEMLNQSSSFFSRLVSRSGEPVIRMAIKQSMKIIGQQFVMGTTIDEALERSLEEENRLYRYSFDMLGEAALTGVDAERYFDSYLNAINTLGAHAQGDKELFDNPGISVKLSALHPRYQFSQRERVVSELSPRLLQLAQAAREANINMTVDAEEADRLELSLDIFDTVFRNSSLRGWDGLGLAVQAYQKRAMHVIDYLDELSKSCGRRIPIRLVKGAYWDTEIKRAQEQGLSDYPVFTRKSSTDTAFLACAQRIINAGSTFYPQFATHNAHTLASIVVMAGIRAYEFQRLHGMGESLYQEAIQHQELTKHCRVYAPVGSHKELLPYLVRRLLENGANTSFVNQIVDEHTPVEAIIANPIHETEIHKHKRHPRIPLPVNIFGDVRLNSSGVNFNDSNELDKLSEELDETTSKSWIASPIVGGNTLEGKHQVVSDPSDRERNIGEVQLADTDAVEEALTQAAAAANDWNHTPAGQRADILDKGAELLQENRTELIALIIREGGRTLVDAHNEVREAVDFCRYYAAMARQKFAQPIILPGVTGEGNELHLNGRGVFACISPWNFPVAIFTGQITAALAAGNSVIAKPAGPTPLCGAKVVSLLHEAGIPGEVLHFLPGGGSEIGMALVNDTRVAGIAFTGSTDTAMRINQTLAKRDIIIPFIAETGGQNAMIVDSSALPEQVVADAVTSAFNSAGQRCSALRVLFVQQDVAPRMMELLGGAMEELVIGDPGLLNTNIGPVINDAARAGLQTHVERMKQEGRLIKSLSLPDSCNKGSFFAPHAFEIDSLDKLTHEVFGPILHVVQYQADHLDKVIEAINNTRYGLTLGVHSRIDATVKYITRNARCGNTYVNRDMIGAVVGSQPFGGEGLSGTGPKAGGSHYLHRFATERVVSINTTAVGGNASLLSIREDDH